MLNTENNDHFVISQSGHSIKINHLEITMNFKDYLNESITNFKKINISIHDEYSELLNISFSKEEDIEKIMRALSKSDIDIFKRLYIREKK